LSERNIIIAMFLSV